MLTRIDHVGIACQDLAAKIAFYESAFGLTVVSMEVNEAPGGAGGDAARRRRPGRELLRPAARAARPGHPGRQVPGRGAARASITSATAWRTSQRRSRPSARPASASSTQRPRHGSMGASIAFLHPADVGGVLTELVQAAGTTSLADAAQLTAESGIRADTRSLCCDEVSSPMSHINKKRISGTTSREHAANGPPGEYAASTGRTLLRAGRALGGCEQRRSAPAIGLTGARFGARTSRLHRIRRHAARHRCSAQQLLCRELASPSSRGSCADMTRRRSTQPWSVSTREVRKHQENAQALQRELADAHRQLQEQERPTYSGLGSTDRATAPAGRGAGHRDSAGGQVRRQRDERGGQGRGRRGARVCRERGRRAARGRQARDRRPALVRRARGRGHQDQGRPRGRRAEVDHRARGRQAPRHRGPRGRREARRATSARSPRCGPPPSARSRRCGRRPSGTATRS